jgi:hypothetical protein
VSKSVGVSQQQIQHYLYRADGTTTGAAQLLLGRSQSRCHLLVQNLSLSSSMYVEIGSGQATATISGGAVTSVSVVNAGFGFSAPPRVEFFGGGNAWGNTSYVGLAQPGGAPPNSVASSTKTIQPLGKVASAHCVMTGSAPNMSIASITVDYGGAGYVIAPYVQILNSDLDPNGAAAPAIGVGILLTAGGGPGSILKYDSMNCPTDPVALYCAASGQPFTCRWMD